jgi:capsular polysaccharide biosynthesis protein
MPEPRLLESAIRRWPVVVVAFVVTTILTIIWVAPKPSTYESSGSYVVQPRSGQAEDSVRAIEALIRGTQINATYSLIARSDAIKDLAEARLTNVPKNAHSRVESEAVTGTNALTISARARDAKAAHALAVAAGTETIAYVENLHQPYQLVLLDPPKLPSHPVNSRKPLTIALGALLGLMVGLGLAAILDRIMLFRRDQDAATPVPEPRALEPARSVSSVAAIPASASEIAAGPVSLVADVTADPGVQRELLRAADRAATYSLGVLKVEPANELDNGNHVDNNINGSNGSSGNSSGSNGDAGANTRNTAADFHPMLHDQALRNGYTLNYVRDGLFAVVLPDMTAVETSKLLSDWLADGPEIGPDDPSGGLLVSMTVVEYTGRARPAEVSEVTPG